MVLYCTIKTEGAMQKAASGLLGGAIGGLTNEGNRVAGALGGAAGDVLSNYIADDAVGPLGSALLRSLASYGTGRLGAMLDKKYGNPIANGAGKVTSWIRDTLGDFIGDLQKPQNPAPQGPPSLPRRPY